ncbi:hypothetical protein [Bacillus sp. KH172YL63]|uniref:hypothetical protein n=1 Tax=Bacillus sp. KH172YL63 TaxID=2709784 RepID=UPI0013E51510|nr:hypothetical protein [Bacillus sp. KH172YL63]BCB04215.1 hypothetical protein KH172YL63_23480 [Bacillus sp. KH172YL63]
MSLLCAIAVYVPIELIVNTNRLTGREFPLELLILLDFIVATLLFYHLSKKWLDDKKSSYWPALLWLPYF